MTPALHRLFLLTVLLLATACNRESSTPVPTTQQRPEVVLHSTIGIPTGSASISGRYIEVPVTLLNRTQLPLPIEGYSLSSPVYAIQFRESPTSTWKSYDIGWCGTGLAPRDLPAGHMSHFTVSFPLEYLNQEVRLLVPVLDTTKNKKAYDIESNVILLR
jgi:hypothetical protein